MAMDPHVNLRKRTTSVPRGRRGDHQQSSVSWDRLRNFGYAGPKFD